MLSLLVLAAATGCTAPPTVEQTLAGPDANIELFVIRRASARATSRGAVVLVHGAGSGGSAIWDLGYEDYSVMRHLSCLGFDVYAFDARGFGGSTIPKTMRGDPDTGVPAVRAKDARRDLRTVIAFAKERSGVEVVDLVAWSWGCVVAGGYAGEHPGDVRRLVLYAPVYDRKWPTRHKSRGSHRIVKKSVLMKFQDPAREENAVWKEHIEAMFRFNRGRDALALPNGPYRDIYGADAPIWSPSMVRAPTLVLQGGNDKASTNEAGRRLFEALGSEEKRHVVVAGAGHFMMREHRAPQFRAVVSDFLTSALRSTAASRPK